MGTGRYGDEVAPGAILAVHRLDELFQRVGINLILAKANDVHVDLLLLELLGNLDEGRLVRFERRTHEDNDASLVVLVLAMFQGQLQLRLDIQICHGEAFQVISLRTK